MERVELDVEPFAGDLLVSNSTTDRIERWTTAGVFVGVFAAGVVFPQQVLRLADGSVLTVSSIATPGVEGVYHFNPDGSLLRFIDTEPLKGSFGEMVPRGAFLLGEALSLPRLMSFGLIWLALALFVWDSLRGLKRAT